MTDKEREDLKDRRQMSWSGWFYAIQRIDLLIISISSAALYVILETFKHFANNKLPYMISLKISSMFLLLAIITNFISQFTGKQSNCFDMRMCNKKLKLSQDITNEEKEELEIDIDFFDSKAHKYDKITNALNIISMILMFIGLGIMITYFTLIF